MADPCGRQHDIGNHGRRNQRQFHHKLLASGTFFPRLVTDMLVRLLHNEIRRNKDLHTAEKRIMVVMPETDSE
ncbi:MAG: hypothetical protein JWM59_5103 [Verrucomicrobiales bacterium]|nr:hypothetical protein [Verrucomicrobiales bacterium]